MGFTTMAMGIFQVIIQMIVFAGVPLLALGLAVGAFGNAILVPSLSAVLSRYASQSTQGATLGLAQACEALARTCGPLLWGGLYSTSRHLPFQISTAFYATAALLLTLVLFQNKQLPEHLAVADSDEDATASGLELNSVVVGEDNVTSLEEQVRLLQSENQRLRSRLHSFEEMFQSEAGEKLDVQMPMP